MDRGRVIKGVKFFDHVDVGDPLEQAIFYDQAKADELVLYDISASHEGRAIMAESVRKVAENVALPLTVGGGIRTLDDATRLIQAGAEKISINSAAVKRPELITEISRKFGRCATVLAIDANRVKDADGKEVWHVFINGGRVDTDIDVMKWAKQGEEIGAGEIVLNVMNTDGTKEGFDYEMTRAISDAVKIPVVASGGAGSVEDMLRVLQDTPDGGHADAALAASIFHFRICTIEQVKAHLAANGVPVRL